MDDFNSCLNYAALNDLQLGGGTFTWSNSSFGSRRTICKLDRNLGNIDFCCKFPDYDCSLLPPGLSDHHAILCKLPSTEIRIKLPLRFFNFWAREDDFLNVVQQAWNLPVTGTPSWLQPSSKELKKLLWNGEDKNQN